MTSRVLPSTNVSIDKVIPETRRVLPSTNVSIVYSYLMCSQAIDQNIFPKVLGTAQVLYCPKPTAEGNRTLELLPVPREILFGLLPGYTLNNCFIT